MATIPLLHYICVQCICTPRKKFYIIYYKHGIAGLAIHLNLDSNFILYITFSMQVCSTYSTSDPWLTSKLRDYRYNT